MRRKASTNASFFPSRRFTLVSAAQASTIGTTSGGVPSTVTGIPGLWFSFLSSASTGSLSRACNRFARVVFFLA